MHSFATAGRFQCEFYDMVWLLKIWVARSKVKIMEWWIGFGLKWWGYAYVMDWNRWNLMLWIVLCGYQMVLCISCVWFLSGFDCYLLLWFMEGSCPCQWKRGVVVRRYLGIPKWELSKGLSNVTPLAQSFGAAWDWINVVSLGPLANPFTGRGSQREVASPE